MKQRMSVFVPAPAAAVLYGAQGGPNTTSDLYIVDASNGSTTSIGPIGFAMTGLAFRPSDGVLFGITSNNSASNSRSLITVDPATGAGTLVGALGKGIGDISFKSDNVLYGLDTSNMILNTINTTTGAATAVSFSAVPGAAVGNSDAFNSADVLYAFTNFANGRFYIVDTSTGVGTQQSNMSGAPVPSASVPAACFDANDVLYVSLVSSSSAHLATLDVATGVLTSLGSTLSHLDAIAWS